MDKNFTISRALRLQQFIDYLTKNINANIDWKMVADKCIDKDNEYCLTLIKAKSWIDKDGEFTSYAELFDEKIKKQATQNTLCAAMLYHNSPTYNHVIIDINKENKNLSEFYLETAQKILNITKNIFDLMMIKYSIIDANDIKKEEQYICADYNLITYDKAFIVYGFLMKEYIIGYSYWSNDILTEQNRNDIANAKIMIWEYLIYNTITYPNVFGNNILKLSK